MAPERVLHNRSSLMAVTFAPDGKALAVADDMGSITLWDLDQSTPIRLIHSDGDQLRQVAFTPDGTASPRRGSKGRYASGTQPPDRSSPASPPIATRSTD